MGYGQPVALRGSTPQYAPPAQPFGLNTTTRTPILYNTYVQPFLNANNLLIVSPDPYRPQRHAGERRLSRKVSGRACRQVRNQLRSNTWPVSTAARGAGTTTRGSRMRDAKFTDTAAGGYTDSIGFFNAIDAGLYDPVMGTGGASVAPFILDNKFLTSHSKLSNLHSGRAAQFLRTVGWADHPRPGPRLLQAEIQRQLRRLLSFRERVLHSAGFAFASPSAATTARFRWAWIGTIGQPTPSGSSPSPRRWRPPRRSATTTMTRRAAARCSLRT